MPDELRGRVESLSGVSLQDVRVHRRSAEPGRIQAHAFTQGREIYLAPGQERHLAHEVWHAAQQARGEVRPTAFVGETPFNTSSSLERDADVMGARAARGERAPSAPAADRGSPASSEVAAPIQAMWILRNGRRLWKPDDYELRSGEVALDDPEAEALLSDPEEDEESESDEEDDEREVPTVEDELEDVDIPSFLAKDLSDDDLDLIDDSEYIPNSPWRQYFDETTTSGSKAKGFDPNRRSRVKELSAQQHYNFQTFTFGLGSRSDHVNLYRSTSMPQVTRAKALHGEKNFLQVQQYTPQFSRGFITGAIDTGKQVFLPEGVEEEQTFEGRGSKGTSVLGRETLTFLQSGYTPSRVKRQFPKPRAKKRTETREVFSLLPPTDPTISKDQVSSIWDLSNPNPSITIGASEIFALQPPVDKKQSGNKRRRSSSTSRVSLAEYFQTQDADSRKNKKQKTARTEKPEKKRTRKRAKRGSK